MIPEGYYEDLVRGVITGRRWITAMDVAVSAAGTASGLRRLGAAGCLAIGASRGTGELPEGIETIVLGSTGASMMDAIRTAERAIDHLPPEVIARVDAFDPDRTAWVIRPIFSEGADVAGRPTYGRRRPEWVALEDKMIVDALWDKIGVARADARIVPATVAALRDASAALDQGLGTVWVGDNRSGWHGGAAYLRWVRSAADAEEAQRFLSASCDRVRVMPFLEGIPCSIHGVVFEDAVIALRPCEMLVLRHPTASRLRYAAAATFWDPPRADRDALREVARRVGVHLRQRVGFRGVFTVDGVMTAEGFRPTELNPRFGAAIGVMTAKIPRLPMFLLHLAICAEEDLDFRPEALEALILSAAEENRAGRVGTTISRPIKSLVRAPLRFVDGAFIDAGDAEPDAMLALGPAASGGYLNITLLPDRTPVGPSAAPRAVAALRYADATYDLGIGPLVPARDVRLSAG